MASLILDTDVVGVRYFDRCSRVFAASNGKLFVTFFSRVLPGPKFKFDVWESADNGATWTECSQTNAPVVPFGYVDVGKKATDDFLVFSFFIDGTQKLTLWRFDMSTSTWEASAYAPNGPDWLSQGGYGWGPMGSYRCDGAWVCQFQWPDDHDGFGSPINRAGAAIWDGSSWITVQLGDSNPAIQWRVKALYVTPDNVSHFILYTWRLVAGTGDDQVYYHQPVMADGSVGSLTTLWSLEAGAERANFIPLLTDSQQVIWAYNGEPSYAVDLFSNYIPVTFTFMDTSAAPTATVVPLHLYDNDSLTAPWLNYLPIAYKQCGLVWEESGPLGSLFYYQQQAIASGETDLCWVQPALFNAGTSDDNIIYGRQFTSAGWAAVASTFYDGAGSPRILNLSTSILNPTDFCALSTTWAYFGTPTAARADGTHYGWFS